MKISLVKDDAVMGVDGVFRTVDVSDLDATIHALQFDTAAGKGRIWFKAESDKGQADLTDFAPYQVFVDRWTAAAPPPPPPPKPPIDFSDVENVEKALKALGLVVAAWNGKTRVELRAAFKTAWDSLP